ncbi:MAG: ATP-binding protein [Croceibacterium sp.]
MLRDQASGRVLAESAATNDAQALAALPQTLPDSALIGGATRDGRYCPCVQMHVRLSGKLQNAALTLFLSPAVFQKIAMAQAGGSDVAALVDRRGNFIARTLDAEQRFGLPASVYVRRAVARGAGEGMYPSVTLEGLKSYSAYSTASRSGWSAHAAIDKTAIDSPRNWAKAAIATAILAALVLAAGLLVYAVFEIRRRRLELQRMVGMQKAEAISLFTSTVSHDFRNILSVIDAGLRLILRHTQEDLTRQRALAIGDAVARGNRLTNQLLSFVRGDVAEVRALDLKACLEGADDLLARSLGDGVAFTWRVDDDARHVMANSDQLELALLNLAINARDAMDGAGAFAIVAEREGEWSAVHASDSGPGVPAELRARIFEAFYSTKGDGRGTGLGLAQVAGAARQAGGRVELREGPDGGACFTIYLPLVTAS